MYVVKVKDKYARFENSSSVRLCDRPEQASLYAREKDAEYRLTQKHYYANPKRAGAFVHLVPVKRRDMAVYVVAFVHTERRVTAPPVDSPAATPAPTPAKKGRVFAPVTPEELKAKIDAVVDDGDYADIVRVLGKDIKVDFDCENFATDPSAFGPKSLIGLHTLPNGLTFHGFAAGGDWQHPVFFLVYWDGKKLRGYVPTNGNPWNTDTNRAYGNSRDEEKDFQNARRRWPKYYADKTVEDFEPDQLDFDEAAIRDDVLARFRPVGG